MPSTRVLINRPDALVDDTSAAAPSSAPQKPSTPRSFRAARGREAAALLLFVASIFSALALYSFQSSPADPSIQGADWVGAVGASLSRLLVGSIGVAAWIVPVELMLLTWPLLKNKASIATVARIAGDLLVILIVASLVHVAVPKAMFFGAMPAAGRMGELFGEVMRSLFSTVGSFLIGLTSIGLILIGRASFSFIRWAQKATRGTEIAARQAKQGANIVRTAWNRASDARKPAAGEDGQAESGDGLIEVLGASTGRGLTPAPPVEVEGDRITLVSAPPQSGEATPPNARSANVGDGAPTPTPASAGVEETTTRAPGRKAIPAALKAKLNARKSHAGRVVRATASPKAASSEVDSEAAFAFDFGTGQAPDSRPPTPTPPTPTKKPKGAKAAGASKGRRVSNQTRGRAQLPAEQVEELANEVPAQPRIHRPQAETHGSGKIRQEPKASESAPIVHDDTEVPPLAHDDAEVPPLAHDAGRSSTYSSRRAGADAIAEGLSDGPLSVRRVQPQASAPSPLPASTEPSPSPAPLAEVAAAPKKARPKPKAVAPPPAEPTREKATPGPAIVPMTSAPKPRSPEPPPVVVPAVGSGFRLPPTNLFAPPSDDIPREDPDELVARARELEKVLSHYGVKGVVADIHTGPTVSTFEFKPAEGTKVSKVSGLADDLALGLSCKVRIIAPIPGKGRIGFEVPNGERLPVNLRELVEEERFRSWDASLPVVLGRDIVGEPFYADLATMPHMIVAGATGAGKSVGLNVMLTSLLTRRSPDELRLLMVDPKVVELAPFDRIPHLLLPVVTDMKQASNALKWAVDEMERRYQLFAKAGTKNITTYNAWVKRCENGEVLKYKPIKNSKQVLANGSILEATPEKEVPKPPEKLPWIVIVVDEFADLMMQQGKEVEASVARLAQKARAAGMHVILATQRPSVDVITGMIKANFPTRVAFRVAQRVDSRTILDEQGAEHLLGRGDMLVRLNGTNDTRRVQCPFVSEEEVQRVTDWLRKQGEPVYDESILAARDDDGGKKKGASDGELDSKYDEAVQIVADTRRCSTSWLQRKMGLGYNRAARIVEAMEARGIVGPANGSKDREVLIGQL